MKFQLAFATLVGFAMTAAAAAVSDETAYVISTRPLGDESDGIITVYGINSSTSSSTSLEARQCGDSSVTYAHPSCPHHRSSFADLFLQLLEQPRRDALRVPDAHQRGLQQRQLALLFPA